MGDFPRPFSGGKNKKQKKDTANKERKIVDAAKFSMATKVPSKVKIKKDFANARNAVMRGIQESVNFANTMHFGKQVAKKVTRKRIY